jgi:hypothetical protein
VIKLTLQQLRNCVASGSYARFTSLRKSITAGHKNRKVPAAVQNELMYFEMTRDALVARLGGRVNATQTEYEWPADKKDEAQAVMAELLAQAVELPGEPIKLADILDGGLCEGDYANLEPFLSE